MAKPMTTLACGATLLLLLLPTAQAAPNSPFVPPPPLRIGIGGDYADGLDGMLAARGLPRERLFPWELSDPQVLKRFDRLFLSCPTPQPGLDEALEAWVKAGGRAYIEVPRPRTKSVVLPAYLSIPGPAPEGSDAVIGDAALALASGLPAGTPIDLYDLVGVLLRPQQGVGARTLARFCPDKGGDPIQGGDAILAVALGQGEFLFSGPTLAFGCFRGEATQPVLGAAIGYLLRDRYRPRLTASAPGPEVSSPAADVVENPEVSPAPPPAGFEAVNAVAGDSYDVTATLGPSTTEGGPASMLLLDGQLDASGKPLRPCLWLAFGAKHVELREGTNESAAAVARTAWQPPTEAVDLLVRRRPAFVSVVLGNREVLRAPTTGPAGGLVALRLGLVPLTDAYCQEVAAAVFFDNFMREPDDPTEWNTVSGQWTNVGVGHEETSVNGFFFRGESKDTALATVGDWFWEDYTVSAAIRPESATACGVSALGQANGDRIAFVADTRPKPWPTLSLVHEVGGRRTVLAARTGALAPQQWYRLALRISESRLEGLVDGEVQLACANPEMRGGGIGLLAEGGAARFDDVLVQPATAPLHSPGGEGTPAPEVPATLGAEDYLTWASPAASWEADAARPSLLWHQGDFPEDVSVSLELTPETQPTFRRLILSPSGSSPEAEWLSATVRTTPGATAASVELTLPGAKPVEKPATLGNGQVLRLVRAGDVVRVLWGDSVIHEARSARTLRQVALEVDGPPVPAQTVYVSSPTMRDYVFGAAPTDWWASAGTWEVAARWACDARWTYFAGWGEQDAAVWNKHPVAGDVTVDYYVAVKMDAPGGDETERCRDLNTVLCGDRRNPRSGYSFILGGDGGVKTQLVRNGVVVAEAPSIRVPPGFGVHQEWFHIRAARLGSRVELDLEGRPVFRWEDSNPLPGGYVGLWTHNSGLVASRVAIYH
ncbi:MAG: hypothetical protein FJX75_22865 [Armatimonadetes bacterium]|nr:hypothetical protein [Armatimonadota bacterium]